MKYNLTDYLDETVNRYPDRTAVIDPDSSITYAELRKAAKKVAACLSSKGIFNRSVAIYVPKSVEAVCILWGVLYSGNYYTFLDEENSEQRLRQIVDKLESALIITDRSGYDTCVGMFGGYEIRTYEEILDSSAIPVDEFSVESYGQTPAYINFTSGTTGVPKGVVVSNIAVIDFISVFVRTFDIKPEDRIGNQAPFDFDVSVKDIYSCAFTGATLVIIPREYFIQPKRISEYMDDTKISVIIWAVSAMCFITTLKAFSHRKPENIRMIMFSGEVMPYVQLKKWLAYYPDATFVNLYGPTEVTCNCTYHILDNNRDYSAGIPIGIPFDNEKVLLLDENDRQIDKENEQGEICAAGITLASGYYRDREATDRAFIQNPCNDEYNETIYRTGDYGYIGDNGELFYAGRRDNQIKLFGHRIELGEIEHRAEEIDGIERACAFYEENKLYLVYFGELDETALRAKLNEHMPEFMIPNSVIRMDEIPVTKNGKIDRKFIKVQYVTK